MSYQNQGSGEFAIKIKKKLYDLRTGRRIKISSGLIGEQYSCLRREGAGYSYALLLTPGELIWIVVSALIQSHPNQQLLSLLIRLGIALQFYR
jgi:hypothetical protein